MLPYTYWIEKLDLQAHPEGGYFRETYESAEMIPATCLPSRYAGNRAFATCTYFLLAPGNFSAFHRLQSDEIWHFYYGEAMTLHIITPGGRYLPVTLGPDPDTGGVFQYTVPRNHWMAADIQGENAYALLGNTVSPGFRYEDFEMPGRETLFRLFPHLDDLIRRYTRK